jgi:hypothetical protein
MNFFQYFCRFFFNYDFVYHFFCDWLQYG